MDDNFRYLGCDCGAIHGFGFHNPKGKGGYQVKMSDEMWDGIVKSITQHVEQNKNLCLVAFTADYLQSHAHDLLKQLGFRRVTRFKSSHDNDEEVLTMWVRENKAPNNTKYQKSDYPPGNCSVTYGQSVNCRCAITPSDTKIEGYKKIRNTKFYYRIASAHVVKSK